MVIASGIFNNVKSNLKSASDYKSVFFLINGGFFVLLLLLVKLNLISFIILLFFVFLINLIAVNQLGKIRRREIKKIREAINSIRPEVENFPTDINLGESLGNIEKDLKEIFYQSKKDISNLQKLEKMRTQFLANVSHELRTPIFAIQGFLETLEDGAIDDPKVNKKFLAKANSRVKNLSDLLNDLIDISMIESGEMNLSYCWFNLYDLFETILPDFKEPAVSKGLRLILQPFPLDMKVYGDKKRIKQVLVNLIQNAIKYTEKGQVELVVSEKKHTCKIAVRDTGIGLSGDESERIFERFFRVDKNRSREIGGTGLGLAIVKHILEAHKSVIKVKSEPAKGSEFSFELKRK